MINPVRPKLNLLNPELIKKIVWEALEILEKHGIFIENTEAIELMAEKGMKINKQSQRVFITPQLVYDSIKSAPKKISLYDRSGDREYILGDDQVHFDPGSAAVHILDPKTGKQRKADTNDVINFHRISDSLENIEFQSTGLISGDVPDIIADSYRLFLGLQYSTKPIVTGTFRVEAFQPMYEMLVAIRGSKEALKQKPLAIFDACPSPPLKWSHLTTQSLIDSARAGIPSELISMGMTGATSPVTIAGTLVQHCVENFTGIVITQLAQKGAPVIFGGSPSSFDMRKGTTPMGAIETMMIDSAYSQIAKSFDLPTHAYMGLSDSKTNDSQAGLETGIGAVLAALSGINVISGPGMMDFESCQSLEKLIIDDEICGMALRLIKGIEQRDDPIALSLFEDFTSETQFLTMPHTRQWYKKEHIFPKIIDRDNYDSWVALGSHSMADRGEKQVENILKQNDPVLPEDHIRSELKKIMTADAGRNDITSLPEISG